MKRPRLGITTRTLLNRYVRELQDSPCDDRITQSLIDCGNYILIENERSDSDGSRN